MFSQESPANPFAKNSKQTKSNAYNPMSLTDKSAGIVLKENKTQNEVFFIFYNRVCNINITLFTRIWINVRELVLPMKNLKKNKENWINLCFQKTKCVNIFF